MATGQHWEDIHLSKAQVVAGHPSCIPKQVFGTASSLMKLKNPRLGFVLIVESTGTNFKALMGICIFVHWTTE